MRGRRGDARRRATAGHAGRVRDARIDARRRCLNARQHRAIRAGGERGSNRIRRRGNVHLPLVEEFVDAVRDGPRAGGDRRDRPRGRRHRGRHLCCRAVSSLSGLGAVGAASSPSARASAQTPQGPPSAGPDAAARLRSQRAADHLLHRSGRRDRRSGVQRPGRRATRRSCGCGPARSGRRAGVERAGPVSGLERHPEQPAAALARGRRARDRVPAARRTTRTATRSISQGRQLSCEHLTRRVVRYEHDGSVTVIAEAYQRQAAQLAERRRAAPGRQLLVHRSAVRRSCTKGSPRAARAADRRLSRRPRAAVDARGHRRAGARSERPRVLARLQEAVRRRAPARGPATPGRAARATCSCSTSAPTTRLSNRQRFADFMIDGVKCAPDGVRCDVDGNVWCSSNAGRARRLQRRDRLDAAGKTDRPHPPARSLRQSRASAARSATACSWPRASRSTRCTSTPRARAPVSGARPALSVPTKIGHKRHRDTELPIRRRGPAEQATGRP